LKFPENKSILTDSVEQLIQSKDIIIVSSKTPKTNSVLIKQQKVAKISNPFIDTLLKPILSRSDQLTFEFIDPEKINHSTRYEGIDISNLFARSFYLVIYRKISLACIQRSMYHTE
jgi:hypothetical protein